VNSGLGALGEDVELRNQLEFQRERCRATVATDTAAGKSAVPGARPSTPPPLRPSGPQWLVQVAALKTRESADDAVARIKRMEYAAFTFRDGSFWKVRAGPFASEAAARAAIEPIRKRLGGKPFVTRAPLP
jgi:cell division septation protein DedD